MFKVSKSFCFNFYQVEMFTLQAPLVLLLLVSVTNSESSEQCKKSEAGHGGCNSDTDRVEEDGMERKSQKSLGFSEHFDLTRHDQMVLIKG
jgi:hypothetical protein